MYVMNFLFPFQFLLSLHWLEPQVQCQVAELTVAAFFFLVSKGRLPHILFLRKYSSILLKVCVCVCLSLIMLPNHAQGNSLWSCGWDASLHCRQDPWSGTKIPQATQLGAKKKKKIYAKILNFITFTCLLRKLSHLFC